VEVELNLDVDTPDKVVDVLMRPSLPITRAPSNSRPAGRIARSQ
jgi:hypothetical protein